VRWLLAAVLLCASAPGLLAQDASVTSTSTARQEPQGRWQLELFGTWGQSGRLPEGAGSMPQDPPFVPLALVVPQQTQYVPSWFFGAGSRLLSGGGDTFTRTPGLGHELDGALVTRPVGPASGWGGGATVVRRVARRVKVEVSLEAARTGLDFARSVRTEAKASRTAFAIFFGRATQLIVDDASAAVSATIEQDGSTVELRGSSGLRIALTETPQRAVYFVSGGGLASALSIRRTLQLRGDYQFSARARLGGVAALHEESDSVDLEALGDRLSPFGYFGAGFERRWSNRTGVHVDTRVIVRHVSGRILLSASPHVVTISDPSILRSGITGIIVSEMSSPPTSIVFDNNLEQSRDFPSSLTGPAIKELEIFNGSDIHLSVAVRIGLFYRF
jgi:hypothetical protein